MSLEVGHNVLILREYIIIGFMFTPFVRILILVLCTILSIIAALNNVWSLLILSSLISVFILFGYFRESCVPLAIKAVEKEDYEKLKLLIGEIRHPDRLNKTNEAYYYFVKGMMERYEEHYDDAEKLLNVALVTGLKKEVHQAMAVLALSDIMIVKGNKTKARKYFEQIRGLRVGSKLMPEIRKMQQFLGVQA